MLSGVSTSWARISAHLEGEKECVHTLTFTAGFVNGILGFIFFHSVDGHCERCKAGIRCSSCKD